MAFVARGFFDPVPPECLLLYRYLTTEHHGEYIAVMDVFCATLLADMSALDVRNRILDVGLDIALDTVEERCLQLVVWTNLMKSPRDPHVPTVVAYQHAQKRFQVTPRGSRLHRQVREIMRMGDGAREVARELLGSMVVLLDQIIERVVGEDLVDAEALAADVTTVFNNQQLFTDSVRDFYAYLGTVLTRYDLAGEEYSTFKGLLLEYVELISSDVARYTPGIVGRLEQLASLVEKVLAVLDTLPTLVNADGSAVERLPGRQLADWDELTAWYTGAGGASGPAQLRSAADSALGQLITNAKRMLASAGTGASRRADLLHLAGLLAGAREGDAQRGFAAAFGLFSARHLGLGPDEGGVGPAAGVSWWDAAPVDVPVALRERGTRASVGRNGRVPDPGVDEGSQLALAAQEEAGRRAAVAELLAAGNLDGCEVSPAAFWQVWLPLLGSLLARHTAADGQASFVDRDLGVVLVALWEEGRSTVVSWEGGSALVDGLVLSVRVVADGESVMPEVAGWTRRDGDDRRAEEYGGAV
ncbi:DUF2397 domain-containing protein [Kitasatospora kifunensis]|uniref:Uncharacterized protein (TIGR02677 family) n=1 Tax=Kitasatospora kifunensis TaxID=58351 RepID=A0A7W7RAB7_KITKI|nr:DUF2397 domain-containing protein [Kitasatospora kifunensis]MBB4928311.1 uncharacterized protein (TIGR02677 family) [Kitasatospora kifunensis]